MELKLFYRTQRDLAAALNQLIDAYWQEEIDELLLLEGVRSVYEYNTTKMIKDNVYIKIIQQVCGKRRLELINNII